MTDAGLKELKELNNLTTLDLFLTSVTDVGLRELASHKRLTFLNLMSTKVTEAGVAELKKAYPTARSCGNRAGDRGGSLPDRLESAIVGPGSQAWTVRNGTCPIFEEWQPHR